ncbi:class I SAM-dependent methyltransferase [Paraburkholderia sp. BCC1884]|uniref:class I SAM-dependent methyltransferase n=1 Tax=Paraburkholderia sp. BCC1884 TaxID=2562668 RepID=UPI0011829D03|nr:class I SAM-dependent methyltransferase [Paraburkholderia sp. BCC1884]
MDRRAAVLKFLTKDMRGLEIGPWYNPLAPKAEGYNCLVLDVFDLETLRARARSFPNIPVTHWDKIEEVDVLGSSTHIDQLIEARGELGTFDYIVSSHNFEHLPNPIRFLRGCAKVLKPGGIISMAMPDRRACFDYFRPVTTLSSWITAFLADASRPSPAQYFDMVTCTSFFDTGDDKTISFYRGVDPDKVSTPLRLDESLAEWKDESRDGEYFDSHCSVFTPSSFELLIRDVAYLNLAPFEVIEIFDSPEVDFYAHLRLNDSKEVLRPEGYESFRDALLHRILEEAAETSISQQRVQALQHEAVTLRERVDAQQRKNSGLEDQLERRRAEVERLAERGRLLEDELRAIRASTSWRLTSPIRSVIGRLRKSS